jgi:hypothetical protein
MEMLAVFVRDKRGTPCLRPLVQLVFEQVEDGFARDVFMVPGAVTCPKCMMLPSNGKTHTVGRLGDQEPHVN